MHDSYLRLTLRCVFYSHSAGAAQTVVAEPVGYILERGRRYVVTFSSAHFHMVPIQAQFILRSYIKTRHRGQKY